MSGKCIIIMSSPRTGESHEPGDKMQISMASDSIAYQVLYVRYQVLSN